MKVQIEFELDDETLKKGGVSEEDVREDLADMLRHGFDYYARNSGFADDEDLVVNRALHG
jgi:hypothetical protein